MVIGGGDLNTHIGNMTAGKEHLCMKYTTNIDSVINSHAQELGKICKSFSCFVVNNFEVGSKVFDGTIGNLKMIHRIGWNPSDHLPISTNVDLCLQKENFGKHASNDILSEKTKLDTVMPKKTNPVLVNWVTYNRVIENDLDSYKQLFENVCTENNQKNLDTAVSSLSDSLYKAAVLVSAKQKNGEKKEVVKDQIFGHANEIFRK